MKHCCSEMETHLEGKEVDIVFINEFREYGISYLDGGTSMQVIYYCPWCGKKLPPSLRSKWFKQIFSLGLDPDDDKKIPKRFLSEEWYSDSKKKNAVDNKKTQPSRRKSKKLK